MNTLKYTLNTLLVAAALQQAPLHAEQKIQMITDRVPSAAELGNTLFSKPAQATKPNYKAGGLKTRSISFGKAPAPAPSAPETQTAASDSGASIGLPIKFGYNSAKILPESKPFLDEIGKMLSMPDYNHERLVIEGHTDASGSDGYNQYLSEKRAKSVKSYLMKNYQIGGDRLFENGMGESQPLPGENPYAAVNRRVQFYRAP